MKFLPIIPQDVSNTGVTEVHSKILTPLETTGGNSFSLEGFEKMLFTIQNLM